jgi:hypothetical protein
VSQLRREEERCQGRRRSPVAILLLWRRFHSSGQRLLVEQMKTISATRAASAA